VLGLVIVGSSLHSRAGSILQTIAIVLAVLLFAALVAAILRSGYSRLRNATSKSGSL
jgi:ABC-type uncharacterized transport system permease subunit